MDFSTFGLGLLGSVLAGKIIKNKKEEKKRKNTICKYNDIITEEIFYRIVEESVKRFKRIERFYD